MTVALDEYNTLGDGSWSCRDVLELELSTESEII